MNNLQIEKLALSLGRTTPNFRDSYTVSFTVSLPECKGFMTLTSDKQKHVYRCIVLAVSKDANYGCIKRYVFNNELTKRGKVHIHGYFTMPRGKFLDPVGLVSDVSKIFINAISNLKPKLKGLSTWSERSLFNTENGITYRTPMLHMEYMTSQKNINRWVAYIHKEFSAKDAELWKLYDPDYISPIFDMEDVQ